MKGKGNITITVKPEDDIEKSNKGRTITIVAEIVEDDYPEWISDAHLNGPRNGIKVLAFGDGNSFEKIDELEDELEDAHYNAMGEDL
jgi:hypothetical protein